MFSVIIVGYNTSDTQRNQKQHGKLTVTCKPIYFLVFIYIPTYDQNRQTLRLKVKPVL